MLNVTIRGRFITVNHKSWSGFTAADGKEVKPGNSSRAYVLDDQGNVREINVSGIDRGLLDKLTFGVEVVCECEARPFGRDLSFRALQFVPAKTLAQA